MRPASFFDSKRLPRAHWGVVAFLGLTLFLTTVLATQWCLQQDFDRLLAKAFVALDVGHVAPGEAKLAGADLVVVVQTREGDLLTGARLERLHELQQALAREDGVASALGATNLRQPRDLSTGALAYTRLGRSVPSAPLKRSAFRSRILRNKALVPRFLAKNGQVAAIYVNLEGTRTSESDIVVRLQKIAHGFRTEALAVVVGGPAAVRAHASTQAQPGRAERLPLAAAVALLVLLLGRRFCRRRRQPSWTAPAFVRARLVALTSLVGALMMLLVLERGESGSTILATGLGTMNAEERYARRLLDRELAGTATLVVKLRGAPGVLERPEIIAAVGALEERAAEHEHVRQVRGPACLLKSLSSVLSRSEDESRLRLLEKTALSQLWFLADAQEDRALFAGHLRARGQILIALPTLDTARLRSLKHELQQDFGQILRHGGVSPAVLGLEFKAQVLETRDALRRRFQALTRALLMVGAALACLLAIFFLSLRQTFCTLLPMVLITITGLAAAKVLRLPPTPALALLLFGALLFAAVAARANFLQRLRQQGLLLLPAAVFAFAAVLVTADAPSQALLSTVVAAVAFATLLALGFVLPALALLLDADTASRARDEVKIDQKPTVSTWKRSHCGPALARFRVL